MSKEATKQKPIVNVQRESFNLETFGDDPAISIEAREPRKLLTLKEFNALSPKAQGYASYMQAELPGSKLPKQCPSGYGIKERRM